MSDAPTPLEIYYASEYHRRNMQVARVCGAQAAVDQALERALTVKSTPVWLIAYLESAANRLPGLQTDLAAWRDLAPDAPETLRADLRAPDPLDDPRVKALVEAAEQLLPQNLGAASCLSDKAVIPVDMTMGEIRKARAALAALKGGQA